MDDDSKHKQESGITNRVDQRVLKYVIRPFLRPGGELLDTCIARTNNYRECRPFFNRYTNTENPKQTLDCIWFCLAECTPEQLLPLFDVPEAVILQRNEGSPYIVPITGIRRTVEAFGEYGMQKYKTKRIFTFRIDGIIDDTNIVSIIVNKYDGGYTIQGYVHYLIGPKNSKEHAIYMRVSQTHMLDNKLVHDIYRMFREYRPADFVSNIIDSDGPIINETELSLNIIIELVCRCFKAFTVFDELRITFDIFISKISSRDKYIRDFIFNDDHKGPYLRPNREWIPYGEMLQLIFKTISPRVNPITTNS